MSKISAYPPDTSPTTDDYLVTVDGTLTSNRRVTLGSVYTLFSTQSTFVPSTGWATGLAAPNTVTALGNRSYSLVFNGVDYTSNVSAGMRLRTTRTVAAPNQCTSLNGTTQYWSKTSPAGMTFTDDFTVLGWTRPTSYAAATIISRYSANGWLMRLNASGQVVVYGEGTGVSKSYTSYQSVPLNKWTHIAASMDMSGSVGAIYIDGVLAPSFVTGAATVLVQAGNLAVGSLSGTSEFFPGKLAQVAVFSAVLSQATIQSYISQGLLGTETNNISVYSFSTSANDIGNSGNNLTANGSATTTNADSPFGGQASGLISATLDYGIVQKATFSTNTTLTVQVSEGCTIPTSGGVASVAYSVQKAPYGMPVQQGKYRISSLYRTDTATASNATFAALAGLQLIAPIGEWGVGYNFNFYNVTVTSVFWNLSPTSITGLAASATDPTLQTRTQSSAAALYSTQALIRRNDSVAAAATYLMYTLGATTSAGFAGSNALCEIFAENTLV